MPLLLLAHPLFEQAQELVEAEVLEHRELLGREVLLHLGVAEPLVELLHQIERLGLDAPEAREERLVECVEVGLVVDAERPGDCLLYTSPFHRRHDARRQGLDVSLFVEDGDDDAVDDTG